MVREREGGREREKRSEEREGGGERVTQEPFSSKKLKCSIIYTQLKFLIY